MSENPIANKKPLIMSYAELTRVIGPYAIGYKWGTDTIHDLWLLGAPVPHNPGKRIILPSQLYNWLHDVLQRNGQDPIAAMEKI